MLTNRQETVRQCLLSVNTVPIQVINKLYSKACKKFFDHLVPKIGERQSRNCIQDLNSDDRVDMESVDIPGRRFN